MKDLSKITDGLSAILQKNMEAQRTNWYSYWNSSGDVSGPNFISNITNYIKMAFFSSALANGKTVTIHSFTEMNEMLEKLFSLLETKGGRLIYKEGTESIVSSDTFVVIVENRTSTDVWITLLTFENNIVKDIKELLEQMATNST